STTTFTVVEPISIPMRRLIGSPYILTEFRTPHNISKSDFLQPQSREMQEVPQSEAISGKEKADG
ncbi:hypothetical protein, partial [Lawsonibacter hominis]|uniref:hypothetical protein n=1 Tax=Lawsonibacter hominis TaxID=2763053 RepID=UPI0033323E0D